MAGAGAQKQFTGGSIAMSSESGWCLVFAQFYQARASLEFARESIRLNRRLPPICIHGEAESECEVCVAAWAQSWAGRQGLPLQKCRHRRRPLECEKCRDTCIEAFLRNDKKILFKVCPWWRPACLTPCKRAAAVMQEEPSRLGLTLRPVPLVIDLVDDCVDLEA